MQNDFTGARLAEEAMRILNDDSVRRQMKTDLEEVTRRLSIGSDPMDRAVSAIVGQWNKEEITHVSQDLVS